MQSSNLLIKIVVILLWALSIILYLTTENSQTWDESQLLNSVVMMCIGFLLFFCYKDEEIRQIKYRTSYLFLIGYFIVFFQLYIDLLLGYIDVSDFAFVNSSVINAAAMLSTSGLFAFIMGYMTPKRRKRHTSKVDKQGAEFNINTVWLKILLILLTILYLYMNGANMLAGLYSQAVLDSKAGSLVAYLEVLIRSLTYAVLVFQIKKVYGMRISFFRYINSLGLLFNLSVLIYLAFVTISGDRGPIISTVSVYVFSYCVSQKPRIRWVVLIGSIFVAGFAMTMLGNIRSQDKSESFKSRLSMTLFDPYSTISKNASFLSATSELAGSIRTLHIAMDVVPDNHPYLYGSFQLRDAISSVPFLEGIFIRNEILDPEFRYAGSSSFITYYSQGQFYSSGEGSSVVADLYLSFGAVGVWIGLFLFGLFIRQMECKMFCDPMSDLSLATITLALILFGTAIYINRASILSQLSVFTTTLLVVYLFVLFLGKKDRLNIK